MNQKLKLSFILVISLFYIGCNGPSQVAPSKENSGASLTEIESENHRPEPFYKYGAGDIITKGYLDNSGNVWFTTTNEGVYLYNGRSFKNFSTKDGLCSNEVWCVIEDHEGHLWFATTNGLCIYDGNTFVRLDLPVEDSIMASPKTGFPSRHTNTVLSLIQDRHNSFWFGTDASGVYRYDEKTFTSFLKYEGRLQPDSMYNNCITSILEDSSGDIWFTSITHGGINRYDGKAMKHFTSKDGLHGDMITSSFEDSKGNLWFGSIQDQGGGLLQYDGTSFKFFGEKDGLCDSNVTCFYEDNKGTIWIGTGDGVCLYDGTKFLPFDNKGESLGDIRFICKDQNNDLWMGGRYGVLWRYDGVELKDFTHKKRNPDQD